MFSTARQVTQTIAHSTAFDPTPSLRVFGSKDAATSPSLQYVSRKGGYAHEVKFLVDEQQAQAIEKRLRTVLSPDSHADPTEGNSYEIATVYCDTPEWDVFHRRGRYRLLKFRARRYGKSSSVFLERKFRQKDRVRKRRSTIGLDQFAALGEASVFSDESACWYSRQLHRHLFRPVCLIGYRRTAYFAAGHDAPIRLTFDRQIRGGRTSGWSFAASQTTLQLLANFVVCELKFFGTMPAIFKQMIHDLQLNPQGVSKYRQCIQSLGVLPTEIDHA
jgi:hypothetical protein